VLQLEWNGYQLKENDHTKALRILISGFTLMQVIQICDYYWNELSIESQTEKSIHRLKASKKKVNCQVLKMNALVRGNRNTSYFTLMKTSSIIYLFVLELLVTLPHPASFALVSFTKIISLLMFLRLYDILCSESFETLALFTEDEEP